MAQATDHRTLEERVERLEEDVEMLKGAILELAERTARTRDRTLGLDDPDSDDERSKMDRLDDVVAAAGAAMKAGVHSMEEEWGQQVFPYGDWRTISHNLKLATDKAQEGRQHALEALAVVATIESEVEFAAKNDQVGWTNSGDDLHDLRKHLNEIQWRLGGIETTTERSAKGQP